MSPKRQIAAGGLASLVAVIPALLTWDGRYPIVPGAWLLVALTAVGVRVHPRAAMSSAVVGPILLTAIVGPDDGAAWAAVVAFAAMSVSVSGAIGLVVTARQREREARQEAETGQALLSELYRQRSLVVETLRRSLIPPTPTTVLGLEVATRFFAVDEVDVGGDFYDVFRVGRPNDADDCWTVVIGDVRGKGAEAAALTAMARNTIRAAALRTSSPATMLDDLNDLLLLSDADQDEPSFCTAAVAALRRSQEDGARAVVGIAGHPAPFVLRGSGEVEQLPTSGMVVGVTAALGVAEVEVDLAPGDALVLYTDGVTERHNDRRFLDEDGLRTVLARCTGFTASAIAERIETAARAFVEEAPRDDIAVVVVRVPTPTGAGTTASADLPADTSAPGMGRRFVQSVVGPDGPAAIVETATLLTSELVTNAVLHGAAPIRVSVDRRDGTLRVAVADGGQGRPERVDRGVDATSGRGIQLIDLLADRWGITEHATAAGKAVWFELRS